MYNYIIEISNLYLKLAIYIKNQQPLLKSRFLSLFVPKRRYGQPRIVRALLEAEARTDIKNMNDSFPLHRAVSRGDPETLTELVGRCSEIDLQARDKDKLAPLHIACQFG